VHGLFNSFIQKNLKKVPKRSIVIALITLAIMTPFHDSTPNHHHGPQHEETQQESPSPPTSNTFSARISAAKPKNDPSAMPLRSAAPS
jgi:hypothetical protein